MGKKGVQVMKSTFWESVVELADSVKDIPPERREMSGVRNAGQANGRYKAAASKEEKSGKIRASSRGGLEAKRG